MKIIISRCLQSLRSIFSRDGGIIGIRKLKSKMVMMIRKNRMKATTIMMDHPLMMKRKKYPLNMSMAMTITMSTIVKTLYAATTKIIST